LREKFNHPCVTEQIKVFFGDEPYSKILCVYDVHKEGDYGTINFISSEAQKLGIDVVSISEIIERLKQFRAIKGSRDDVLRLLDLIYCCEKNTPKIIKEKKELWDIMDSQFSINSPKRKKMQKLKN